MTFQPPSNRKQSCSIFKISYITNQKSFNKDIFRKHWFYEPVSLALCTTCLYRIRKCTFIFNNFNIIFLTGNVCYICENSKIAHTVCLLKVHKTFIESEWYYYCLPINVLSLKCVALFSFCTLLMSNMLHTSVGPRTHQESLRK